MANNPLYKSRIDEVKASINSARSKWGLAQDTPSVNTGDIVTASYIHSLSDKLTEAKNKSGWSGNITTATKGEIIRDITGDIITQANSIQNHCVCYGQCTGSCSGSCTGSCSDTCLNSCKTKCKNSCRGDTSCGRSGH